MAIPRPLHVGKFVPPPYAGVEAHVDTLLRCLGDSVDATLVAAESPQRSTIDTVRDLPYRVLTTKSYGKFASAFLSPAVPKLVRQEFDAARANILHVHAPNPWGDVAALTVKHDVPVVITWHSDIVRQKKLYSIYRHIQRRVLKRADVIIVPTLAHYESSEQLHQLDISSRIATVPLGIDVGLFDAHLADDATTRRMDAFAKGRPLLLTVGRHVAYKGYSYLIDAMKKIETDSVLVMIGTGILISELKQQAEQLNLNQRVLFLGEVGHASLVAALHRCDAFCLPSITASEAFGLASAEAMACGKPTIVCELGNGVNFLNRNGETSITVQPRDSGALANAIDTMMSNNHLRLQLGNQARSWVHEQFSLNAMKTKILQIYQSVI